MAFTLEFFLNNSDPKTVTKTLVSLGVIQNCTMRDELDVRSPRFLVETQALPTAYNYCKCEYTGRLYFVRDTIQIATGLSEIVCECDTLSTFDAYLRAQTATVTRNQKLANGYLIDNRYNSYAYEEIVTKSFPSGLTSDSLVLLTVG